MEKMNVFLIETYISLEDIKKKFTKQESEITNLAKLEHFTQNDQIKFFGKYDTKNRYYKEPMMTKERSGTSSSIGKKQENANK